MIIDADAHVVETEHTWDYLDGSDKKFRPQLFQSSENSSVQCWFLDGKIIGFRNPEAVRRSGTKGFPKNPLKEFKIYVSAQTDDDFPYVLKYGGEDNIVIGTDYGHSDASSEVDAITIFRSKESIGEAAKKKILDDNPRELYAL